ncbi:E3 ubiquitin-protein ligase TRIM9-like [Diaphorina citri]|uniref:E3 ubiquitin-protein ligase TRIM9-like n=1 Tax=Diaphorina citri TaxID=121845 RepID=A0A3Q0IMK4_DIACI|nr:E3 ubiquitin-protein ligase TRIM9-like [Diaphorina citri]
MEDELRCPSCKQFFNNPVLLPCYHSLCLNCAILLQQPAHHHTEPVENSGGSTSTSSTASDHQDVDKLSILSETDSGVVCSSSSRPNSYVGTPNFHSSPLANSMFSLCCTACRKTFYFDEHGANNLIKYRLLQNIVDKYGESKNIVLKCQLCEQVPADDATVICEQCEILYCEKCRENCHPARGPLAKHNLLNATAGKTALRNKHKSKEMCCDEHPSETLTFFCQVCRLPVCNRCMLENRHVQHDVQPISAVCKAQKTDLSQNLQLLSEKARSTTEFIKRLKSIADLLNTDLSQNLQLLSEKARSTTEFIKRLKSIADLLNDNSIEFESQIVAQCDALIKAIEDRKKQLVDAIRLEKESKQRILREQVSGCACKLQRTTALLQFCIEALKETDAAAFLQVGSMLIHRVASDDMAWQKDVVSFAPQVSSQVDLTLDDKQVLRSIQQLNFIQMKQSSILILAFVTKRQQYRLMIRGLQSIYLQCLSNPITEQPFDVIYTSVPNWYGDVMM